MYGRAFIGLLTGTVVLMSAASSQAQVGHRLANPRAAVAAAVATATPMARTLDKLPAEALGPVTITLGELATTAQVMVGHPGPAAIPIASPVPTGQQPAAPAVGVITPENYGYGAYQSIYHYTDYLVSADSQVQAPQRFSGWFVFTAANGGSYRCSAALISRSILVTAGHCVHAGGTGSAGWIRSGTYYPAYRSGPSATYGAATVAWVITTSGWYSQGALDQGYDVGLVVLNNRTGTTTEIGDFTGWFGACFRYCLQNFWYNSQLGYPGNYYDGELMTRGEHLEHSDGRDFILGSGMQGGSSGGPHVTNLGDLSDASVNQGQFPYRNIIFAVTSWGYVSDIYKIQGASSLSGPNEINNFPTMFNYACATARSIHGQASCSPV